MNKNIQNGMAMARKLSQDALVNVGLKLMQCPFESCGYKWFPRVENPKKCPMCLKRLKKNAPKTK